MPEAEQIPRRDMRLKVLLPTEVLVDEPVSKIIAEAEDGFFCLLPRHVDFVSALVPGVLSFFTDTGGERFAAIDRGVLVKCGRDVFVSAFSGVRGTDMDALQSLVETRFVELDEHARKARSALARLEAGTLRAFRELQQESHG